MGKLRGFTVVSLCSAGDRWEKERLGEEREQGQGPIVVHMHASTERDVSMHLNPGAAPASHSRLPGKLQGRTMIGK